MNLFDLTEATTKKQNIKEDFEIVYEFVKEDYASLGTGGGAGVANGGGGAAGTTSPENNTSVIGSGADNLTEFDPNEYSERYTVYRNREKIQSFPDLDQATEYIDDWLSVEDTGYADVWEIVDVDGKTVWEQDPHDYGNANKITIGGKGVGGMLGGVGESLDEDDQWHSGTSDQWHGATSDEWHGTGQGAGPATGMPAMREADTAERLKRNLKKNGFDMDSFDAKIAEIERRNRELADEFYARHPELDDRVKDESATMFTSIGSDAGAGIGAATLGTDNNISPVGSGTVDEGYEDEVGFGVNSDQAYRAVMAKFGDYIEHRDNGVMYAPRELWSAIEQTAFDADGVGAEEDSGIAEDQHSDFESKDSIRVWENIDDRLDMEEKMSIFESWSRGQLNESADEHKLEYFRSLEHYSSNPVVGKTYIVVPLALSHQLRALSVPEKCKYLGFKNHMHLVENQVGDVKKYPYAPFRPNSSFICFFFDSINKYNQFRSSILVKFNLSLNDINEELNAGGSNQEPASDSTSPVGGGGASVEESKEAEITEDIYESRLYKMKRAGYFE